MVNQIAIMPHPAPEGGACMEKAMNVETSTVTKLLITGAPNLDPISVYLEDLAPCKGKIAAEKRCFCVFPVHDLIKRQVWCGMVLADEWPE